MAVVSPTLKTDPEFQKRIPPLKPFELEELEASLKSEGCRDAIVVCGIIADGHHRFALCQEHGIEFDTTELDLPDRAAVLLWMDQNQLGRRNLTDDQRAGLAERIRRQRSAKAKRERGKKARSAVEARNPVAPTADLSATLSDKSEPKTDTRADAAKDAKIPEWKLREVAAVVKEKPEILESIISGEKTLKAAKAELKKEKREMAKIEAVESFPAGGDIHTGDLSDLDRLVDDESADIFFTDPPYQERDTGLFGRLAELAERKLKPGGLCLVYSGQMFLPTALDEMRAHLDYCWEFAIKHSGAHLQIWNRMIWNDWKPVLVFAKRPIANPTWEWTSDFCNGGGRDKQFHEWGQDAQEATYWIERLTAPGALVVDPFCGGGAILAACKATGRRWIATEIDEGNAAIARKRVL